MRVGTRLGAISSFAGVEGRKSAWKYGIPYKLGNIVLILNEFNISFKSNSKVIAMGENVSFFSDNCRTITLLLHVLKIIYSNRKTTRNKFQAD